MRISRSPTETPVVVLHERRDEGVGALHGVDALKAELFDEPVLQRVIHPLDATLGLRAVRTDDLDVEVGQCTPELSNTPVPAGGALLGHAKYAVLVAVKRHGLAVVLEVRNGRGKVVKSRFGLHEAKLHQTAGGVVNVDQQRAIRPAVLEPGVLAAVYLDQLAQTLAPVPG